MPSPTSCFDGLGLNEKYPENATEHGLKIRSDFENILQTAHKDGKKRQIPEGCYYHLQKSFNRLLDKWMAPSPTNLADEFRVYQRQQQQIQRDQAAITSQWRDMVSRNTMEPAAVSSMAPTVSLTQEMSDADASHYKVIVKLIDRAVIAYRQGVSNETTRKDVNGAIWKDPTVNSSGRPREESDPWNPVCAVHQLPSGDFEIYTYATEDVAALAAGQQWPKVFGALAHVLKPSYGVVMHSVRSAAMPLDTEEAKSKMRKALGSRNVQVLGTAEALKIGHIGYLTRGEQKKHCSVVVGFEAARTANLAMARGLVWDGAPHHCERYVPNTQLRQCHNCSGYRHYRVQCKSTTRCGRCGSKEHTKSDCPPEAQVRCVTCKADDHHAWMEECPRRKLERKENRRNALLKDRPWPEPSSKLQPEEKKETGPQSQGQSPPQTSHTNQGTSSHSVMRAAARQEEEMPAQDPMEIESSSSSALTVPTPTPATPIIDPTIAAMMNMMVQMSQQQRQESREFQSTIKDLVARQTDPPAPGPQPRKRKAPDDSSSIYLISETGVEERTASGGRTTKRAKTGGHRSDPVKGARTAPANTLASEVNKPPTPELSTRASGEETLQTGVNKMTAESRAKLAFYLTQTNAQFTPCPITQPAPSQPPSQAPSDFGVNIASLSQSTPSQSSYPSPPTPSLPRAIAVPNDSSIIAPCEPTTSSAESDSPAPTHPPTVQVASSEASSRRFPQRQRHAPAHRHPGEMP